VELEPETLRRMAACFAGRACCRCGRPAERLVHQRFYCDHHFPVGRTTQRDIPPKVYHCWVSPVADR
jgi:hypothetical protein